MEKTKATRPSGLRPGIHELIDAKKSMLDPNALPMFYDYVFSTQDAVEAALPPPQDERILRMHIVWDNKVSSLYLGEILDRMRETGAAMVVKVEEVK